MKLNLNKYLYALFFTAVLLTSCNRVTVIVEDIPANTPIGENIYIVGNFNSWSPGGEKYQMKLNNDSTYSIILPAGYGQLQYKFTRGNWTSVEKDLCGEEIDNRIAEVDEDVTLVNSIESWADLDPIHCNYRVVCIEMLPENTPSDAGIALAGEFNSWDSDQCVFKNKNKSGALYIHVQRPSGMQSSEFKVTRGSMAQSESDVYGNDIPNRVLDFGIKDTLKIRVEGWKDKPLDHPEQIVLILKTIPKNTPLDEAIYFASRLNGWKSGDKKYRFRKNEQGQFYIELPRKMMNLDYKITRNGWHTVEVNKYGGDISNRNISLLKSDTVYIDVVQWKDL